MSIELDNLRYVGLYEEPAGSYQVDHAGTPGDFIAVPYKEGAVTHAPNQANHDPMTGTMRLDHQDVVIPGHKKGQVSLGITLHSHGLDLDGTVDPPTTSNWALLRLLKATLGGTFATTKPGAQTKVVADNTTTTVVEVTSAHGARFAADGVIACQCTPGSSVLTLREIDSVDGDKVTVKEAFPSAPITGTPVRGGVTVHLTENPDTSLQVLIEGRSTDDGMLYRGLQLTGGPGLELPVGEQGTITFAMEGGGWDELGVSAVTIPSYAHYATFNLDPLDLHFPLVGDTTETPVCTSAVSIAPAIAYVDQVCGRSENGVARKVRNRVHPAVTGTFTTPRATAWRAAREAQQARRMFAQLGNLAGRSVLVSCATVQITDVQDVAGPNGIASQTVTWQARHDAGGSTTPESYSVLRFHFV